MVLYFEALAMYSTVGTLIWLILNPVHYPASYRKASFVAIVPFWPVILAVVIAIGFNFAPMVLFSRFSDSPVFDLSRENADNPMVGGLLQTNPGTGERRRALGRSKPEQS